MKNWNNLDTIDKEIKQFRDNKTKAKTLRRYITLKWEKECQKDISCLGDILKEKIKGTKKAFDNNKAKS